MLMLTKTPETIAKWFPDNALLPLLSLAYLVLELSQAS